MTVTIGSDPEIFLRDTRTGGLVPVCGKLGGTKGKPLELGKGYGLQEDNVMAEFNIPPCTDGDSFAKVVSTALDRVHGYIAKRMPHVGFDGEHERLFTMDLLSHPQALQFGCSPDFDAYNYGAPCDRIDPATLVVEEAGVPFGAWRFAGGHVHLGYARHDQVPGYVVAAFADLFLGLPSVGLDKQPNRRTRYGAPGRFRPTKYGIEYRVLSNFWVQDADLRTEVGWRAMNLGIFIEQSTDDVIRSKFKEVPWSDVRAAIANEDAEKAADLLVYCQHDLKLSVSL